MTRPSSVLLTKILATVGPACEDPHTLDRLIEEGVRVFRLNFSHGSLSEHENRLNAIRQASDRSGIAVGVLGDLSGPKIRVGKVRDGGIFLAVGDQIEFQRQPLLAGQDTPRHPPGSGATTFSCTYPQIVDEVEPGHRMLIDDGAIRLLAIDKVGTGEDRRLICNVTVGGLVTSAKGINLPETELSLPSLTDKDLACVDWAVQKELDFLALSFVRTASDIQMLKELLTTKRKGSDAIIPVVAKIEMPAAVENLEAIVEASEAVMVARGDLGVEMDLAKVPVIQKRIIQSAHDYGKPVIVATQMLQSMIESASPTRAEVSDVANAIYDGADAVMLSGETAVGKYPIQVVATMARIAHEVEHNLSLDSDHRGLPPKRLRETRYRTAALAHGVGVVVHDLQASVVAMWSELGGGARYLSQNRLGVPIVAASSNKAALRRMAILFGVMPVHMELPMTADEFLARIDPWIVERGLGRLGDPLVVVDGEPLGNAGVTNRLRIHYLGDKAIPQQRANS